MAAVEGVGPLSATALVAAVGNATDFRSGRELAAYSDWFHAIAPAAGARCCWGSASVAIAICARCWFTVRARPSTGSSGSAARAPAGPPGLSFVVEPMWRRWHWRTRMPGCCGRCSAEGRAINQRRFPPASPKPVVEGTPGGNGFTNPEIVQAVAES